jgi:hypothetical protein
MKRNRTKRAWYKKKKLLLKHIANQNNHLYHSDTCRKRKMKCEIEEGPNCTRCIEANQTCVFSIS